MGLWWLAIIYSSVVSLGLVLKPIYRGYCEQKDNVKWGKDDHDGYLFCTWLWPLVATIGPIALLVIGMKDYVILPAHKRLLGLGRYLGNKHKSKLVNHEVTKKLMNEVNHALLEGKITTNKGE